MDWLHSGASKAEHRHACHLGCGIQPSAIAELLPGVFPFGVEALDSGRPSIQKAQLADSAKRLGDYDL